VQAAKENELLAARQDISNKLTPAALQLKLLEQLPIVAEKMPKPDELKQVTIGGDSGEAKSLAGLVASVGAIVDGFRNKPNGHAPDDGGAPRRKSAS
jgi:hypothetical protein